MRSQRLTFVFLAFYLIFFGGSAYYTFVFPIRIFHHALMTILMGIWYSRKFRGEGIPQTALNLPLLGMIMIWVLSALLGSEPRNSIEGLWFIFLHITLFFVLTDLFQHGRGKLVMETQFLMGAVIILLSGLEIVSWYLGLNITPNTDIGWIDTSIIPLAPIRLALAMNISTLLAGYVAPLIMLIIGWAITVRRKDYRQVLWVITGLLTIILILTFSRGGLLSLGIGLGSFFMMRLVANNQRTSYIKWVIPLAIIGAIGGILIFTISQARSSGDEGRLDMYRSAIEMTLENPLLGVGIGNYGRTLREYRTPELARDRMASAHNLYLNSTAETGFLGILASLWLAGALLMAWWRVWKTQDMPQRKIRHEAVIAAILGVGAHSMVDVFTTTPLVSLIVLLIAYSVVGHKTVLDDRPKGNRLAALAGIIIVIGYGIFFIQTDRAYSAYLTSLRDEEHALANTQLAQSLDPELNLYTLQIAYLSNTIEGYKIALQAEPTWDVGWLNLAYLYEQGGQYDKALNALYRAEAILPISPEANYNIGRLGETYQLLDDDTIVEYYYRALIYLRGRGDIPTQSFWTQTALRTEALRDYIQNRQAVEPTIGYILVAQHFPDEVSNYVPQNPKTGREWWVVGEYALTIEKNPQKAIEAFTNAITTTPQEGDYYASRARAKIALGENPDADLNIASLLPRRFESVTLIRADIAEQNGDTETAKKLRESTQTRVVSGDFAGVLYHGRIGIFDLPQAMLPPSE